MTAAWIDSHGNAITLISTAVTAIATVAIAILTLSLASENKMLRKAGTEPEVVAYLSPHPHGNGAIRFVIENIGKGSALKVYFKIIFDTDDFKQHDVQIDNNANRTLASILPEGEKITALLGIGYVLAGKSEGGTGKPLKPFSVEIRYENRNGKKHSTIQSLDICQFSGLRGIFERPPEVKIAYSIENIDKNIARLVRSPILLRPFQDTTSIEDSIRQIKKSE